MGPLKKKKTKILIVEDNPSHAKLLQEFLIDGFELRTISTGSEAINSARKFLPDIVLLDIRLPDLDGIEICYRMRSDARLKAIKILIQSALASQENRASGLAAGADDYIAKPFEQKELLSKIERLTNS